MSLDISLYKRPGEPGHFSLIISSGRLYLSKALTMEHLNKLEHEIIGVKARRPMQSGDVGFDPDPEDDLPF